MVGVTVEVGVTVFVGVKETVDVGVLVLVGVWVCVTVGVDVRVGVTVGVRVEVDCGVGVSVGVEEGVRDWVTVGVGVGVGLSDNGDILFSIDTEIISLPNTVIGKVSIPLITLMSVDCSIVCEGALLGLRVNLTASPVCAPRYLAILFI